MQAVAARWVLTDKEQPLLGAVLIGSVPAHRTGFRGVIRIDLDCQGPRECGLVADERMQFSKGPLRVDPVGFACLWRDWCKALAVLLATAALALCSLSDIGEVLSSDKRVWVLRDDRFGDTVVCLSFQPSLSLLDAL